MSDFDEMRLVFKADDGFTWRCPCGLGSKTSVSSAGKARNGARDHINRRHGKPSPQQAATAEAKGKHESGLDTEDFDFVADVAKKSSLRFEALSGSDFASRVSTGIPGHFSPGTQAKLAAHYRYVDHVLVIGCDTELPIRTWMPLVDGLTRRGYAVLYDIPDWRVEGGKAILIGLTLIPDGPCQAYVNSSRTQAPAEGAAPVAAPLRPCPNRADHLVVMPEKGAKAKALKVGLCRLHRRTYAARGYDLSLRGGDEFVDFEEAPQPVPAPESTPATAPAPAGDVAVPAPALPLLDAPEIPAAAAESVLAIPRRPALSAFGLPQPQPSPN